MGIGNRSAHAPDNSRIAAKNGTSRRLRVVDLHTIGYEEALRMQLDLVEKRRNEEIPDTLLLLEHPPVITMGKSANKADVLADPDVLAAAGATVHVINRGGEVTYHGPGQLVGYIIANLYNHDRKLRRFIENLEEVFVRVLGTYYGITAARDEEHRGVWVGDEKITAVGIAVKNKITMHGFAFNVNTDLSHFEWIVACGIRDRGQTSLEKLTGAAAPLNAVKRQVADEFQKVFQYDDLAFEELD
jgi:lipoyl(octanoyl) transferase